MMSSFIRAFTMARRILGAHHLVMDQIRRDREFREAVRRMRAAQNDCAAVTHMGPWDARLVQLCAEAELAVDQMLVEAGERDGRVD